MEKSEFLFNKQVLASGQTVTGQFKIEKKQLYNNFPDSDGKIKEKRSYVQFCR